MSIEEFYTIQDRRTLTEKADILRTAERILGFLKSNSNNTYTIREILDEIAVPGYLKGEDESTRTLRYNHVVMALGHMIAAELIFSNWYDRREYFTFY